MKTISYLASYLIIILIGVGCASPHFDPEKYTFFEDVGPSDEETTAWLEEQSKKKPDRIWTKRTYTYVSPNHWIDYGNKIVYFAQIPHYSIVYSIHKTDMFIYTFLYRSNPEKTNDLPLKSEYQDSYPSWEIVEVFPASVDRWSYPPTEVVKGINRIATYFPNEGDSEILLEGMQFEENERREAYLKKGPYDFILDGEIRYTGFNVGDEENTHSEVLKLNYTDSMERNYRYEFD